MASAIPDPVRAGGYDDQAVLGLCFLSPAEWKVGISDTP